MSKKIFGVVLIIGILGFGLGISSGIVGASRAVETATRAVDAAEEAIANLATQALTDAARQAWDSAAELVDGLREGTVKDELAERLAKIQDAIADAQEVLDIASAKAAAEDTASAAVATSSSLLGDLTTQELVDSARNASNFATALVRDLEDGAVKTDLTEQLAEIEIAIAGAQEMLDAEQAASAAVEEAEGLLTDLVDQSQIKVAKNAYTSVNAQVAKLHEGMVKTTLTGRVAAIKSAIDEAQIALDIKLATEAVEAAEALVPGLATQGSVNKAKNAYSSAQSLVKNLHNGSAKNSLSTRISKVKAAIDKVQQQLDAEFAKVKLNFNSKYYTYSQLNQDLQKLVAHYPDLASTAVVGSSVEGRNIRSITVGKGSTKVLITGAQHASEWLTTAVLMRTIETLLWDYSQEIVVEGESVKHILDKYSITFIPMVNPDGVTLVQQGADAFPHRRDELLALNEPWGNDFSRWKANIRGVDINRNYNFRWDQQTDYESYPDPRHAFHPGPSPESEPETRVVANWVRNNNPKLYLDYHSYGQVLNWWHLQSGAQLDRDRRIVRAMRDYTGFRMESAKSNVALSAMSRPWVAKVAGIPSITVEVGHKSPRLLTMGDLPGMFNKVKYLPLIAIMNSPDY